MTPLAGAGTAARIAFYGTLGAFVLLEQRTRLRSLRSRAGEHADRGSLHVIIVCVLAGVVGAFALASAVPGARVGPALRDPAVAAGVILMWGGIALRQWSIAMLGRFFTVDVRVEQGQPVVDTGPYRLLRHPSYTGLLVTFAGLGVALGNGLSLAAVVLVPAIGLIVRIRVEERALLEALGEPYGRFLAGRRRLLPGIW